MLFIAIGAVAATGAATAVIKGFVVVALVLAVVLGLLAWGVLRSIKLDLDAQRLDSTIQAGCRSSGRTMCDCGHQHDPDEMHVVGAGQHLSGKRSTGTAECRHDGSGADCSHSCDTCVLATMRPSPHRTRVERLHSS